MQRVTILVAGEPPDSTSSFRHADFDIVFHRWTHTGVLPLLDGPTFAFIALAHPDPAGLEACRQLRRDPASAHTHIVMMLAEDDREARSHALAAGADDCMVGPLGRTAMLDRVLAALGAASARPPSAPIRFGDLTIDPANYRALWQARPIPLLPNDLRLLRYLTQNPGRVFTREELITALGKHDETIDARTVDVWVGRLRRALAKAGADLSLRTVRSLGYVLDRP